jgi:hypothetical protein
MSVFEPMNLSQDREDIGFNTQRSPVAYMPTPADGRAVPAASNAFAPQANRARHGASVVSAPSPMMAAQWSQMQQMQHYQNSQQMQVRHFCRGSLLFVIGFAV